MIKYIYHDITEKINIQGNDNTELVLNNKLELYNFFDRIHITKKIDLKEEKEVIFFYNSLDDQDKKLFNIKEYFDCIDIAYNFYNLMQDIHNNMIEKEDIVNILDSWQEKYIDTIYKIDEKMKSNKKYCPKYLKYFDCHIVNNYTKLYLINIFNISKREKEILNNLGIPVEFHLYVSKEDYDETNNILKNITYKKIDNVKAYSFNNTDTFLIYLTQYLQDNIQRKEKISLVDFSDNKKIYKQVSQNLLDYKIDRKFNVSKTVTLLNHIYNILENNNLIYPIFYAVLDKDFVNFFEIKKDEIEKINSYMENSKKYINTDLIDKIRSTSLDEIYDKIIDTYTDEASIFVEALTEINSIKDFEGFNISDDELFNLKLLIKYLNDKPFKKELASTNFSFSTINNVEESDELILLNLQDDLLKKENNFILSNLQRSKLKLSNNLDMKYEKYYPYIRKMYNKKSVLLFFIQNIEEDIEVCSVFKDLIYQTNIDIKNISYTPKEKIDFLNSAYSPRNIEKNEIFLTKKDNITLNNEFDNIHINAYNFYEFMESNIEIYFSNLLKKNKIRDINVDEISIGANVIGNIVHKIFEIAINRKEYNNLDKIKDEVLEQYRSYIITDYFNLYNTLLFTPVLSGILKFLKDNMENNLSSEIKLLLDYKNLNINIRQDILVESENGVDIVDIKTGKYNKKIDKHQKYQLMAYRLFNELNGKNINDTYLYFPFNKNSVKENENITVVELNKRIDEINKLTKIEMDAKDINYGLIDILRGSDYEL
ncbi:PD-(D/E)XK nuclease family protein [Sneathia vaginalis]|uniref:PD-(D/E)XK nuclease family protein n=1 Tax=Sneathia vaginalis TaxID=187101 RepID=UPI00370D88E3